MTATEVRKIQDQQIKTLKWPHVAGFEDGQTYDIGISEEARVNEWIMGTLEGILEMGKSCLKQSVRREVLGFEVRETTSFEVKRPDRDGNLNWP